VTVLDDETVIRMERIEYALKAMAHEALRDEDAPK